MSQFFFDEQGNVRTNLTHDADHEKIEYFLGQLQSVHPNSRATLELDRLEVALRNGDFVDSDATEDWDDLQNKSEERRYIADQTALRPEPPFARERSPPRSSRWVPAGAARVGLGTSWAGHSFRRP